MENGARCVRIDGHNNDHRDKNNNRWPQRNKYHPSNQKNSKVMVYCPYCDGTHEHGSEEHENHMKRFKEAEQ